MGKRLRPHTLITPKPLIRVCNTEIVKILCQDIVKTCGSNVENIGFVVGHFEEKIEKDLLEVAKSLGAKGCIFYQEKPLGTADAIWCAKDILKGNTVVAFADTLFNADFTMDLSKEGIIWTSIVENPSAYGVVKKDESTGKILQFVEKPQEYISKEAIIGIYYFKSGERLYEEIKRLIDNYITRDGEYQLTDCLENMLQSGYDFTTETVGKWMDCGNKNAVIDTNKQLLTDREEMQSIHTSTISDNTCIVYPCYIGKNVKLTNSVIGPYVTVEDNVEIKDSVIKNSIIGQASKIEKVVLENALLGENIIYNGKSKDLSLGAYSNIDE